MSNGFEFLAAHNLQPERDPPPGRARLIPMTHHRLLQVSGPDAVKFLQGQVTCDLRRLEQQDHLLGAHCNPKGRIISSFTLAGLGGADTLGLRLRANLADAALAALRKYIVFSKARIEASTRVSLALLGEPDALQGALGAIHKETGAVPGATLPAVGKFRVQDDLVILRHAEDHLEIWTAESAAAEVWQGLASVCVPVDPHWLDLRWIERGLVEVQAPTAEEFIPQMLNYHLIDGVSFKKGCYTGQEIIARMQYRGQLKKHTYRIGSELPLDLEVGAELATAGDSDKPAATVVAAACGSRGWQGLVVTAAGAPETAAFLVEKKTAAKLHWLPLPYAIPNQ